MHYFLACLSGYIGSILHSQSQKVIRKIINFLGQKMKNFEQNRGLKFPISVLLLKAVIIYG